ncbi:MAG: DUF3305 domain-containing protein [Hyphomicrobiales bacterium]|nr:DUF3305 domain-containing protein [Hyphomicrobiales bacterium]
MSAHAVTIGVVIERRASSHPWADVVWLPAAVLPAAPAVQPWTELRRENDAALIYAGAFDLALHPADAANYRDNLLSGEPKLWVSLRSGGDAPVRVVGVTADPAEGEALSGAGDDIVEPVAMPPEIASMLTAFVDEHYVERAFYKRQRDRADPEALARGPIEDADD